MKYLIILLFTMTSYAISYSDKVPGKTYTYRQLLLQRSLNKQLNFLNKKQQVKPKGKSIIFQGYIKFKKDEKTKQKIPYVYIRNCGDIKVPIKEEYKDRIENGTRINLTIDGRKCEIFDWSIKE